MPDKKLLQDMIPVKINKIHSDRVHDPDHSIDRAAFHHFQKPKRQKKKKNPHLRKIWLIVGLIIVCIAVIIAAITYVYAKAVVIITPKTEQVAVSGVYTASKSDLIGTVSGSSGLPYEVVETSEIASTTVPASQGQLIADKAWGVVILYNAYSATPQKLLVGTRLVSDKGLIYKTASTVTVPGIQKNPTTGKSTASSTSSVVNPTAITSTATSTGSVAVYVVADQSGAEYDIAPMDLTGDFKIVAFQGTSKYNGFYGRLRPNKGIIGGYSGYREILATSTLGNATANLTKTVTSTLTSDLKTLVPDGYVLYNGAYSIRFASTTVSTLTPSASSTSDTSTDSDINPNTVSAIVSLKGSLYGIMFKKTDLAKAVAPAQVAEFPPNQFVINNIESLKFTPIDSVAFGKVIAGQNGSNAGQITFNLSGSFGMVGTVPKDTLAEGLVGLSVAQSKDIFAKYSTIMSAHAIITPFWKHSFPDSANKITIDIEQ